MIDFSETLTVKRFSAPAGWVDGYYNKGTPENISIEASVQQLRPYEVQVLPEHMRSTESKKLFTETKLRAADEKNNIPCDVVLYDGKEWDVMGVSDWSKTDIPHYEIIMQKKNDQGGGNAP